MNTKHIKSLIALSFVCLSLPVFGQNYADDLLRYSQNDVFGSGRIKAIGGAQTALGGDIGAFSINPAGVAFYRTSDVGLTLQYGNSSSDANYFDSSTSDAQGKFTVPQFGVVFATARNENDGSFDNTWKNFAFGITVTRTNDFNNTISYQGLNPSSSITRYFAGVADDLGVVDDVDNASALSDLAYHTYLIEWDEDNEYYYGLSEAGNVQQANYITTEGGASEAALTFGGNFGNRIYIGGSVNYFNIKYKKDALFSEYDIDDPNYEYFLTSFDYNESIEQNGSGFNAKLGAIIRPVADFRIGLSLHSPTFINMTEDYFYSMTSFDVDNQSFYAEFSSIEPFEYNITTPFKASAGLAKFFGSQGFLTADIDYIDYSSINIDSDDPEFDNEVKQQIDDRFQSAVNIRVGGEYKVDAFSLRAGYAFMGSPEKNLDEAARNYITAGLGYRYQNFYIDLAGIYNKSDITINPYIISENTPMANIDNSKVNVLLTVGTRF